MAKMNEDEFRKAAHAAIEDSKGPLHACRLVDLYPRLTQADTPLPSHSIQQKHHRLPGPTHHQTRLSSTTTPKVCA